MRKQNIKFEYLILTIIFIFAFFLRTYALGTPPLWIDESISAVASLNILEKGLPIFDSNLLYDRGYFFHYSQSFFLLFGQTDFFLRFVSVIFGMLTILLAYLIGKEYSKYGGIISALCMSIFYLEVFYSRQARFYQLFQLAFFVSLYFLYKSRENPKWLYLSLITLFITIDSQIAGLVLCPFFIVHILIYNQKWLSIIPSIPLIKYFVTLINLPSGTKQTAISYASKYFSFTSNMIYMLILFVPGIIWAFIKKKRLTFLIVAPSIVLLISILSLKTFALRYVYFFAFPLVLYTSLFFSFLYERYGKYVLIAIVFVLIFPSNLIFPHTGINIIKPIDYNFYDYTAPEINLKNIQPTLKIDIEKNILISYFSSGVEWYIKKPDFVLPFSMDGRGSDQISYNNSDGNTVDIYSGSPILQSRPLESYYLIADIFSTSKLRPSQREMLNLLIKNCSISYENQDLKIYNCSKKYNHSTTIKFLN
ncbi:MAG: glycosyltransferase family 39 protein [Candidatus Pacearchaeota archaeon]